LYDISISIDINKVGQSYADLKSINSFISDLFNKEKINEFETR